MIGCKTCLNGLNTIFKNVAHNQVNGLRFRTTTAIGEWINRYPPADTTEWIASLGNELSNVGGSLTILPDASSGPVWETEPLTETLRVAGTPRLHVDVTTATVGGQLYALMEDCYEGTCIHVGHAIMDLRYHAGGDDIQTWTPIFETINAKMEFFPLDAMIAEGHTIRISLASTGEGIFQQAPLPL